MSKYEGTSKSRKINASYFKIIIDKNSIPLHDFVYNILCIICICACMACMHGCIVRYVRILR